MATTACELTWLKLLLKEMDVYQGDPMIMHCDNKSAIHIAANPVFHDRTKHIEVDCNFVRDKVTSGEIVTPYS